MLQRLLATSLFLAASSLTASAGTVRFEATGTVSSASGATGTYAGIASGQAVQLVFDVATPGVDVNPGHVTNYSIVPASLHLTMGPVTVGDTGGSMTATMRNADPLADGVLASAVVDAGKNLGFSFSDCSGTIFTSTDPEQNYGSWSGNFYCVYGWTVSGTGTFISIDLSTFEISPLSVGTAMCFGDGTQATACPCANDGTAGRGCDNSVASGGALLTALGSTSPDTVVLTSTGELPTALSIVLQGDAELVPGSIFGDGVRCAGGNLRRLYVQNAVGGTISAPAPGDLSITARSAALGDTIAPGTTRWYQVYYRDPDLGFCPTPPGNSWNVSNGLAIGW